MSIVEAFATSQSISLSGYQWLGLWDDTLRFMQSTGVISRRRARMAHSEIFRMYDARQGIVW